MAAQRRNSKYVMMLMIPYAMRLAPSSKYFRRNTIATRKIALTTGLIQLY